MIKTMTQETKDRIADLERQKIDLNDKDFKKIHSFYWLFSIDLKSSNELTQSIIENWIKKNQNYETKSWEIDILSKRVENLEKKLEKKEVFKKKIKRAKKS